MNDEIERLLTEKGVNIVRFADISNLPANKTQGYAKAIVFCMALSKDFIIAMYAGNKIAQDDFADKERKTDALADWLAEYLQEKGYRAYSQSEKSLQENGKLDTTTHTSILPHKTIALLAGIGYIGKNNLLITEEYGCAISICTVLTDAPIKVEKSAPVFSKCELCYICKQVCTEGAILGNEWSEKTGREGIIDVFKCACTFKCMVNCPKTLDYALQSNEIVKQRLRLDSELPLCTQEWGWKYHHLGIPTTKVKENESYIPFAKVFVSEYPTSPFGVEWMRWEADSDYHPLVKTMPHLAFVVDDLDWELSNRGFNVIVPPNPPSEGVRVAIIEVNGAPIELMEFGSKRK